MAEVKHPPEKAKPEKKKKDGFLKKATRFVKELKSEIKKVVWPSKKQVVNNTGVVLTVMACVGVFTWVLDFVLATVRGWILGS